MRLTRSPFLPVAGKFRLLRKDLSVATVKRSNYHYQAFHAEADMQIDHRDFDIGGRRENNPDRGLGQVQGGREVGRYTGTTLAYTSFDWVFSPPFNHSAAIANERERERKRERDILASPTQFTFHELQQAHHSNDGGMKASADSRRLQRSIRHKFQQNRARKT